MTSTNYIAQNGAATSLFDLKKIDWHAEYSDWKKICDHGAGFSLAEVICGKYNITDLSTQILLRREIHDRYPWAGNPIAAKRAAHRSEQQSRAAETMTTTDSIPGEAPGSASRSDAAGDEHLDNVKKSDDEAAPDMEDMPEIKPRKTRFRTRQADKLAPPPSWMIPGIIEEGCDAALYAPTGFLKSFLAMHFAMCIATGTDVLGLPVNQPGPVIYYCGEGYTDVIKHRAPAWEIAHRREPYSVDNIIFGCEAPFINDRDGLENDMSQLLSWLSDYGGKSRLTIIDTLNRALNGQDEDRAHTASAYLNTAKMIRERLGGSTLTVAHKSHKDTGSDRGVRGSSAFEAGFDTVLEISEHVKDELTGTHTICLRVKKQKSGEDGARYYLQSRPVDLEDGATSLVLVRISEDEARSALDAKPDNRRVTADLVETALLGITDGGYVSRAKLVDVLAKRLDKSKGAIEKALERGTKSGELKPFTAGHGKWTLPEIVQMDNLANGACGTEPEIVAMDRLACARVAGGDGQEGENDMSPTEQKVSFCP